MFTLLRLDAETFDREALKKKRAEENAAKKAAKAERMARRAEKIKYLEVSLKYKRFSMLKAKSRLEKALF